MVAQYAHKEKKRLGKLRFSTRADRTLWDVQLSRDMARLHALLGMRSMQAIWMRVSY